MPTVHIEAQLSPDDLLQAVGQLSQSDLERFVAQVFVLLAQRRAPSLSHAEAELLLHINTGLPLEIQQRYDALIARRRAHTLTSAEYDELLRLTDVTEAHDVQRIEDLVELAHLRHTTLPDLMDQLGIEPPSYG